jgi:hypothetical protein
MLPYICMNYAYLITPSRDRVEREDDKIAIVIGINAAQIKKASFEASEVTLHQVNLTQENNPLAVSVACMHSLYLVCRTAGLWLIITILRVMSF